MDRIEKLIYGILVLALLIFAYNSYQIDGLTGNKIISSKDEAVSTNNPVNGNTLGFDFIPKGIPSIYGLELGVSYDDVSSTDQKKADSTIKKLGILDEQITLSGKDSERYISIVSQISCEYCCGVDSIIFKDGKPACGCQHSFAMRGLAKYLIKNHGNKYTNDEILEELGKWKTLFFPMQIEKKAQILQQKGIALNYINLASNKYRRI